MVNYNHIKTLEELINHSIRCFDGMRVTWPQYGDTTEVLHVMDLVPKFPRRYASNNSTVSYVHDGNFYVMPYTRTGIDILEANHFRNDYFYVPFSNWDYPTDQKVRWEQLREMAKRSYREDFISDCEKYSDEHGYGIIEADVLEGCFKIPVRGVTCSHLYYKNTTMPLITGDCLDYSAIQYLGHYNTNNGKVVFVYRDGSTYVAKGYGLVPILQSAGYKKGDLFVPFSNGEMIEDPIFRNRWEGLKKFA